MSNFDKVKTRTWLAVLYPLEDKTHFSCIQKLNSGHSFCAIDHVFDVYDEFDTDDPELIGKQKKPHTHVYIRFKSPRFRKPIAEELGIKHTYLEPCRDTKSSLLYFLHDGYPDKYQYDIEDVYGSLKPELQKLLVDDDEGSRVLAILDLLDTMPKPCTYRKFLVAVCNNGMYSDFRRMGSGINKLLDEHNGAGYNLQFDD